MKRKAADQPQSGKLGVSLGLYQTNCSFTLGPISAVAARRARQNLNQAAPVEHPPPPPPPEPEQQSDAGPPHKKARASETGQTRKSSRLQNKSKSPKSTSKQSSRSSSLNGRRADRSLEESTAADVVEWNSNDAAGEGEGVQPSSGGSESDTGCD